MRATKPQTETAPVRAQQPGSRRTAFGDWLMRNVRAEIAAGRVRATVDENGERHAIN